MAIVQTSLSGACRVQDQAILVASLTGFVVGNKIRIDDEIMNVLSIPASAAIPVPVVRGQDGSAVTAHSVTANVAVGLPSDFRAGVPGDSTLSPYPPSRPDKRNFSYGGAGALTPVAGFHIINGTAALAMTLASPTGDQDGDVMIVASNGKAAHTVTYTTTGFGNVGATADVLTFKADQTQAVLFVACNGFWVLVGIVAGAATVAGVGLG